MGKIATEEGYSKGMVVCAARPPINDKNGSDAQKNVQPYTFYQEGPEEQSFIITDKASKKDMVALCSFIDIMYSKEGSLLKYYGLSKEQYEASKDEYYTKNGLTEGAYTDTVLDDGTHEIELVDKLKKNESLAGTVKGNRLFGINFDYPGCKTVNSTEAESFRHNLYEWTVYTSTGRFEASFLSQLSAEDQTSVSKIETYVREFGNKSVPGFIQGDRDPNNDEDWNGFVKAISKYEPEKVTQIYQNLMDQLSK